MGQRIGIGYLGADAWKISQSNEEVVPFYDDNKSYSFYKFKFIPLNDCTVTINKETTLFIPAYEKFEITEIDRPIISFVIHDADVTYWWKGHY